MAYQTMPTIAYWFSAFIQNRNKNKLNEKQDVSHLYLLTGRIAGNGIELSPTVGQFSNFRFLFKLKTKKNYWWCIEIVKIFI